MPKTSEIGCTTINPPVTTCEVGVQCLLLDDGVDHDDLDTDSASFHDTSVEMQSDDDYDPLNMDENEMDIEEEEIATSNRSSSPPYVLDDLKSPQNQQCYIVFEESLFELLKICRTCGLVCDVTVRNKGTMGIFTMKCPWGHQNTWKSQPEHCQLPWGNMLLAAAVLFSGSSPSKAITLFKHMKLPVISLSTYCLIQ